MKLKTNPFFLPELYNISFDFSIRGKTIEGLVIGDISPSLIFFFSFIFDISIEFFC
jgi:hypothetical protein